MSQRILPSFLQASVLAAGLISPSFGETTTSATPPTETTQNKKTAEVILYSAQGCPHCVSTKKILDEKKIPYKVIDVQWKKEQVDDMEKKTGKRSVPQILINGKHIGGYLALAMMSDNELDELLSQPAQTNSTTKAPSEPTTSVTKAS